jgi:hypothetical protein
VAVLSKHLTEEVVPPGVRVPELGLPPDADRIVMRSMAKAPGDRYGSAAEVQAELEKALAAPHRPDSPAWGIDVTSARSASAERPPEITDSPTISIHVLWGFKQQNTVFATGKSIIDRSSKTNVGALMLSYGGGGHEAAGTCQIEHEDAPRVLDELIQRITTGG